MLQTIKNLKKMLKTGKFWSDFLGFFAVYIAAHDIARYLARNDMQEHLLSFVFLMACFFVLEYRIIFNKENLGEAQSAKR